jgi:uncharacterized protein YegL
MTQPQAGIDALPVQSVSSRILITLVVDTSSSMSTSGRITELNQALQNWRRELLADPYVAQAGEISLVTFGKDHVVAVDPSGRIAGQATEPFVPVADFSPPTLQAGGVTPMVEGLQYAMEITAARRQQLRSSGIALANRPLIYLLTDGVPTDAEGRRSDRWRDLAPVIRQQESGKHLLFFAIGVTGAEREVLQGLAPDSYYDLGNVSFAQVLRLVSASIDSVAEGSRTGSAADAYAEVKERLDKSERIRAFLQGSG